LAAEQELAAIGLRAAPPSADNVKDLVAKGREGMRRPAPLDELEADIRDLTDEKIIAQRAKRDTLGIDANTAMSAGSTEWHGGIHIASDHPMHEHQADLAAEARGDYSGTAKAKLGTARRSVLEHELGERAALRNEAPRVFFSSHASPEARRREFYMDAARNPEIAHAKEMDPFYGLQSDEEKLFFKAYREAGGLPTRGVPAGGKQDKALVKRFIERLEKRRADQSKQAGYPVKHFLERAWNDYQAGNPSRDSSFLTGPSKDYGFFGKEAPESPDAREARRREILRKATDERQTQKYERSQETKNRLGPPVRGMSGWSQERPSMLSRDPEGTGGVTGSLAMGAGKAFPFAEYVFSPAAMLGRFLRGQGGDWKQGREDVKNALYGRPEYPGLEAAGLLGTAYATRGIPPAVDYADMATFGARNPELMPEADPENPVFPLMAGANKLERKLFRKELSPESIRRLVGDYGHMRAGMDAAGVPPIDRLPPPAPGMEGAFAALHDARLHAGHGSMRPETIDRQNTIDRKRVKEIVAKPRNRVKMVVKPRETWGGITDARTGDIELNITKFNRSAPKQNVSVISRGARNPRGTGPVPTTDIPTWTKRRGTLVHETAERATAQAEAPFLGELPQLAGHGGPAPRMKEWEFLANRHPDLFAATLYSGDFQPGKIGDRETGKLYREWGGSYGRPLPTDKKTMYEFAVKLRRALLRSQIKKDAIWSIMSDNQKREAIRLIDSNTPPPTYTDIVSEHGGTHAPLFMDESKKVKSKGR
jgi:hypothetical protein